MPPLSLVPSFPAPGFTALEQCLTALRGVAKGFQIDMVDGVFVPHTSWPFTEVDPMLAAESLRAWNKHYVLEIDCMLQAPEQYLDTLAALGVARVVIHVGSTDAYEQIIEHAKQHNYRLGLAFTNDRPLDVFMEYHDQVDFIQLMGIAKVGQQGQPFDTRTLDRARALRQQYPELEIAVDGSVNTDTIPMLYAAGVNRFTPGSAITRASDPVAAYKQLQQLLIP